MSSDASLWKERVQQDLDRLRQNHLHRARRIIRPMDATHVEEDGRRLVNFSSNNYLGLTHHPKVLEAARFASEQYGFGSGAAPLITGYGPAHASAEKTFAAWKGTEAAIMLPSGYQANLAAVQTIAEMAHAEKGVRFLIDKLAHASLVDAVRSTGQPFRVFPHNGMAKLERLMADAPVGQLQVVVTESIFSMDGDAADLAALAKLKEKFSFVLLLDEAHATGVYGVAGSGLATELNLRHIVDVSVFTLSKALGGIGGVVCGSQVFCDLLINRARAYLFSTGIPAAVAAAGEMSVHILRDEPHRQQRLRETARHLRDRLTGLPFGVSRGDSPIIPIILGTEESALAAAQVLKDKGLLVLPVRPPTVPRGSSRLRLTVSSEHTSQEIDQLIKAMKSLEADSAHEL